MTHVHDGMDPGCLGCAAIARRHGLVRGVVSCDDELDDIRRAQIWARIEAQTSAPAARRPRWQVWAAAGVPAVAVAAAAVIVWIAREPEAPPAADVAALVAPAGATLSTGIGPYTRASLVGPARLELDGAPGETTAVHLRAGTLIAEFSGGAGRALRIAAPGAVIDIVGTLFEIDVVGTTTCVAVAHGKVQVTTPAAVVAVGGGEEWCSDSARRGAIAPAKRDAMRAHEAVIAAQAPPPPTPPLSPPASPPASAPTPVAAPAPSVALVEPPRPAPIPMPPPHAARPVRVPPAAAVPPVAARVSAVVPSPSPSPSSPPQPQPKRVAPLSVVAPASPAQLPPTPTPDPKPAMPAAPAALPVTADSLYHDAEVALAAAHPDIADHALAVLIDIFPTSPLVDQALYDRAGIAYRDHAWARAQQQLDRLAALPSTPLAEPGAYLSCRVAVDAHDDDRATRCLDRFRRSYPSSPHDVEALGMLVQLAVASGGCPRAADLIAQLVDHYPATSLARAWKARCEVKP